MQPTWIATFVLLAAATAQAQESRFHAELQKEGQKIHDSCSEFKVQKAGGCVITLATQSPIHAALGSLAPKNGFGIGAALVTHFTPSETWRVSWNSDGVGAPSGAWRAGTYVKAIRTAVTLPQPVAPGQGRAEALEIHDYPVISGYAEATSLPRLSYYGLGSATPNTPATFGMRETIVGGSVVWPLAAESRAAGLRLAVLGEANLRDVVLREGEVAGLPQLTSAHTEETAPGAFEQPATVQFSEGLRVSPTLVAGHLALTYVAKVQQYVATSDSRYSFRRWLIDLEHEIPLYTTTSGFRHPDTNGPDECKAHPAEADCPPVSRNRTGTITVRLLALKSQVGANSVVPFYFQPTLGGSDINGTRGLASYDDYRFRGPHLLLVQETLEHSLYGPVGVWIGLEQGTVALQQEGLLDPSIRKTFGGGATIRAGGFPAVFIGYSTGGPEGNHFAFTVSTSLLGGSSRPSLW